MRLALGREGISNFGPTTIPQGKLFVLVDNHNNSADSRFWGFLDANSVMGKWRLVYWHLLPKRSIFDIDSYWLSRVFTELN